MTFQARLKETPEDLDVKKRLWDATQREAVGFSERYAAGFCVGERYSDAQRDTASAAKNKGYPVGLIREVGDEIRRGSHPSDRSQKALSEFCASIGLAAAFAAHDAPNGDQKQ